MIGGFLLQVKPHLGLRGGSGSRQVGVVDFPIIGNGQLAGVADHSMIAVVPEQQLVGEGDISLRRFVPQGRIKVPTSYISYKKEPADDSSSTGLSV